MLALIRDLLAHAEWANAVFFQAWAASPARDHEDLRRRLEHIIGVQHGFLAMLRGEATGGPSDGPPMSHDDLKAWAKRCHDGWADFATSLDDAALARTIHVAWFPDPPCVVTAAEAIVQVAMHSQHHRGQCMTRLRDLGGEPRNVDFIIWLWQRKPSPNWN